MRVIITGGSGSLGRQLVEALLNSPKRYEVVILSRNPKRVTGFPDEVRIEKWDAKSAADWGELAEGAYAIINLAGENIGEGRWTAAKKERVMQSRLDAGNAVVEAIRAAAVKPKVLVQASAVGFYGNRGDEVLTESSSAGNNFLADVCVAWENVVKAAENFTRVIYLRTGVVLTTNSGALPKLMMPMNLFAGGPLGNGKQWFPWIHIDDEIGLIVHLMEHETASGIYNLVAPEAEQNKTFVKKLGTVMNRPAFAPAPAIALKLILGEMSALVLDSQRVVSERIVDTGYQFTYPDTRRALQDIIYNEK